MTLAEAIAAVDADFRAENPEMAWSTYQVIAEARTLNSADMGDCYAIDDPTSVEAYAIVQAATDDQIATAFEWIAARHDPDTQQAVALAAWTDRTVN
jgi:hypothetical protein